MTTARLQKTTPQVSSESRQLPVHSIGSELPQLLPAATKAAHLLPALERLCSAKTTVTLTEHQAETWLAALSVFETTVVHEAVIRAAVSPDPFPDLGKLVAACDWIRRERQGLPAQDKPRLGTQTLKNLAIAWQLDVG